MLREWCVRAHLDAMPSNHDDLDLGTMCVGKVTAIQSSMEVREQTSETISSLYSFEYIIVLKNILIELSRCHESTL